MDLKPEGQQTSGVATAWVRLQTEEEEFQVATSKMSRKVMPDLTMVRISEVLPLPSSIHETVKSPP
jgi:hypothetical protein